MYFFGSRIRKIREDSKLSVQAFADKLGLNKGSISSYENEKYKPSAETLVLISEHFGVSPEWLLLGTGSIYNKETFYNKELLSIQSSKSNATSENYETTKQLPLMSEKNNDIYSESLIKLTNDEKELLNNYRKLNAIYKGKILSRVEIEVEKLEEYI